MQEFPIFKTKIDGDTKTFALEDPAQRREYFLHKARPEIEKLREYLKSNTFVAFMMGKKNSGKGTYTKLFMEQIGPDSAVHLSVGDIVRGAHADMEDVAKHDELVDFFQRRYRGPLSVEKIVDVITGRDATTLLPTEVVLALVEREIGKYPRRALFIDGFPRLMDQVSLALYFRALMGYRDDPDFFVFLNVSNSIIDERIKNRVVCPKCKTPRSPKLLRTKNVGYDEAKKEFYLMCDNPGCDNARMVPKEGDALGIEPIKERLKLDDQIAEMLLGMSGIEKIQLRNSIPVATADHYVDHYELTPSYTYRWDAANKNVIVGEEPWTVPDDTGAESYSLMPSAVVLGLIKRTAQVLKLV